MTAQTPLPTTDLRGQLLICCNVSLSGDRLQGQLLIYRNVSPSGAGLQGQLLICRNVSLRAPLVADDIDDAGLSGRARERAA